MTPTPCAGPGKTPINQIDDLTQANRYAYVGDDPTNFVDPTGEFPIWRFAKYGLQVFSGVQCGYGAATWRGSSTFAKFGTIAACAGAFVK